MKCRRAEGLCRSMPSISEIVLRSNPREPDRQRRAFAVAFAFRPDFAAVSLYDVAANEEPETEPRQIAVNCVRCSTERLKYRVESFRRQSDAGIGNGQCQSVLLGL